MNTDSIFIEEYNLPKPLPKQKFYELWDKVKQGDEQAREIIILHNIRLVLNEINKRFNAVEQDKKDLFQIGCVGLIKAVEGFDISKKINFSTYAIYCIDNEILMFLRKAKKNELVGSFDAVISYNQKGEELKIEDILSDDTDIVEEYNNNETFYIIRELIKDLPERDREIVMLYFGFYNDKTYTQREIANMFSISQVSVSKVITKVVKQIRNQLEEKGIIELKTKSTVNSKINCKTIQKLNDKK